MKYAVLVAVLSLAVPAAALAAPRRAPAARTQPHAEPHRSKEPLHFQLARAVFPRERWQRLVSDASLELTQRLSQASQGHFLLDPDFAERLRKEYERLAPYEELVGNQAQILERQYTAAEQRRLLAFYRSPLGQKSVLLIHDLTAFSDKQMQEKVHAGIGDALARLKPYVHPAPGMGSGDDHSSGDQAGDGDSSGDDGAPAPDRSPGRARQPPPDTGDYQIKEL